MEPLIYTSKGNVPISSLTYETEWDVNPAYIKFVERHRDSTGEVVKESAHVYDLKGLTMEGIAASLA
jgi:hypothetical protein